MITMNITHGLKRALQINANGPATAYGARSHTWREVGERVSRLAAGLSSLGVNPSDRIAVLSLNSDRYFELYHAIAWAGAVIVPLNIRWGTMEIEDALRDCCANVLVVDKTFEAGGSALAKTVPCLKIVYADDDEAPVGMEAYETLIQQNEPMPDAMRSGGDLAGIFYTGGTTGRSKGVMLSHHNLMANARNLLAEGLFPSSATYLFAAPMFHIGSVSAICSVLLSGGSNVIIQAFTPEGVMAAIQNWRVTDVPLVPTMIQMLVDNLASSFDLSSLKNVLYGGSPISEALLDRATAAFPRVHFTQGYGMTELSAVATLLHWNEHVGDGRAKGRHRSAGRAILGCEVRIVDTENRPLPPGEVGEIIVRGDNVMMGYWERPNETARAIIDGWMYTGDAGRMDVDGFVYVVDRIKDMIVTGGENVYSSEVENAIAQHPGVAQCAVIGIPSEKWGEQVHAMVVPKIGAKLSRDELSAFCRNLIAGYKCPRSFVISEAPLPTSAAGKVLKQQLRKPFWGSRGRGVS
jgi:long-chain acyl-CoA synthetase